MTGHISTRVVLDAYAPRRPGPAAEFRWSPDSGVSLTVIDAVEAQITVHYGHAHTTTWHAGYGLSRTGPNDAPPMVDGRPGTEAQRRPTSRRQGRIAAPDLTRKPPTS
jgi:hypothetical protein